LVAIYLKAQPTFDDDVDPCDLILSYLPDWGMEYLLFTTVVGADP
jgi:hypothetical protein